MSEIKTVGATSVLVDEATRERASDLARYTLISRSAAIRAALLYQTRRDAPPVRVGPSGKSVKLSLRIPGDLHVLIDRYREDQGIRSLTELVRIAVFNAHREAFPS